MSYFDASLTDKRSASAAATPHVMADQGFGASYRAQRLNTYGMLEEGRIRADANTELGKWVSGVSGARFTSPTSPDFTNDPFQAMKTLEVEGAEVPEQFRFDSQDDFYADALEREATSYRGRQETLRKATGAGKFGALLGGLVGSIDDPENIVTLPLGAPGRAGIAMTALIEGAVGAGVEGAAFGPRQELLRKMGVEGDTTRLRAMAEGFAGGAILGGGLRALTGSEIYQATGRAVRAVGGLRRVSEVLQESDDPVVRVQGHAIQEELDARQREIDISRRDSLVDDAAFLNELQAGRLVEWRVGEAVQAANEGRLIVPVRTSDDVTRLIEVGASVARSNDLFRRFELGETVTLPELDQIGAGRGVSNMERHIIEYYDMMDARFRGQEIPDEFDPIDDVSVDELRREAKFEAEIAAIDRADAEARIRDQEVKRIERAARAEIREAQRAVSAASRELEAVDSYAEDISARSEAEINALFSRRSSDPLDQQVRSLRDRIAVAQERTKEAQRIRDAEANPADYGNNLSRTARASAAQSRAADDLEVALQDEYTGIMAEVQRIAVATDDGGVQIASSDEVIREMIEDQEFAEQIKLCGLQ